MITWTPIDQLPNNVCGEYLFIDHNRIIVHGSVNKNGDWCLYNMEQGYPDDFIGFYIK